MLSVASCPARFLEVCLYGAWGVGVNDEAHVGLVDAHAEGVGGHDDAFLVSLPVGLMSVFHGDVKSGMEICRAEARLLQVSAQLVCLEPAHGVDDGAAVCVCQYVYDLFRYVFCPSDDVGEVAAPEGHAEDVVAPEV